MSEASSRESANSSRERTGGTGSAEASSNSSYPTGVSTGEVPSAMKHHKRKSRSVFWCFFVSRFLRVCVDGLPRLWGGCRDREGLERPPGVAWYHGNICGDVLHTRKIVDA